MGTILAKTRRPELSQDLFIPYTVKIITKHLRRGYFEPGTWSTGGNPMKLQKLWHSTGPIRWPKQQENDQHSRPSRYKYPNYLMDLADGPMGGRKGGRDELAENEGAKGEWHRGWRIRAFVPSSLFYSLSSCFLCPMLKRVCSQANRQTDRQRQTVWMINRVTRCKASNSYASALTSS